MLELGVEVGYLGAYYHVEDPKKAFELFQESAVSGCEMSQYELAECYYYGDGVEEDDEDVAYAWYSVSLSRMP